jgi:hypothetical protein
MKYKTLENGTAKKIVEILKYFTLHKKECFVETSEKSLLSFDE